MANSTSKTAGTTRKAVRSGSEALAACVAKTNSDNEPAAEHPDTAGLTEANRRSFQAFVEANVAIMDEMNALSTEMVAFGGKRLNANLERSQSLMGCEDAEKALRVHSEFFESATRQYLKQVSSVMEVMTSISRGFWTALDQRTQETSRDPNREAGSGKSG
jgi:hypothetical protein